MDAQIPRLVAVGRGPALRYCVLSRGTFAAAQERLCFCPMNMTSNSRQASFTSLHATWMAVALLLVLVQLGWEASRGGILTHHFLHRADLPGVHNAWSLVILPSLAWWAASRAQRRGTGRIALNVGLGLPLLLGLALSVSFAHGAETASAAIFLTTLAIAVLLPGYRAECLLGWVLGMSYTFGAALPLVIGLGVVGLSALMRLLMWPLLRWLFAKLA